jgi:hypothetical protein
MFSSLDFFCSSGSVLVLITLETHHLRPCVLYIRIYLKEFFCALFQVLLAGQGLNDNQWHTLRFSRRGSNLKLQVDDDNPIRGTGKSAINLVMKITIFFYR